MNTEQDPSGEDVEETLHHNENYDSGTERRRVLWVVNSTNKLPVSAMIV